jgi:hypothetical protein
MKLPGSSVYEIESSYQRSCMDWYSGFTMTGVYHRQEPCEEWSCQHCCKHKLGRLPGEIRRVWGKPGLHSMIHCAYIEGDSRQTRNYCRDNKVGAQWVKFRLDSNTTIVFSDRPFPFSHRIKIGSIPRLLGDRAVFDLKIRPRITPSKEYQQNRYEKEPLYTNKVLREVCHKQILDKLAIAKDLDEARLLRTATEAIKAIKSNNFELAGCVQSFWDWHNYFDLSWNELAKSNRVPEISSMLRVLEPRQGIKLYKVGKALSQLPIGQEYDCLANIGLLALEQNVNRYNGYMPTPPGGQYDNDW